MMHLLRPAGPCGGLNRRSLLKGAVGAIGGAVLINASHKAAFAADGRSLDELYAAAKTEGPVDFYCSNNPVLTKRVMAGFHQKYPGLTVNVLRLATGPLGQRYLNEAKADAVVADLVQLADPVLHEEIARLGHVVSLEDLPAHISFPAAFKTPSSAVVGIGPHTITYNTSMVEEGELPKKWEDLLLKRWSGDIMAPDPRTFPVALDWFLMMRETYGVSFLKEFGAQKIRYVASTVPGTQQLAAGEVALLVPNQRQVTFSVINDGGPVDDTYPLPMSGHEAQIAVSKKAKSPNTARLLANFIMSPEGQELTNKNVGISVLPNIPGAMSLPAQYRRSQIKQAFAERKELVEALGLTA